MNIKGEEITFLLGAGASKEAGIPISNEMVEKIEDLVENNLKWKDYKALYNYLKSSINYSDGIQGKFNNGFNIERLLIVITEIEKRENNLMYPFIGTWNNRLLDLSGVNFKTITEFHELIRSQLIEWVGLKNYKDAQYFENFSQLSTEIGELIKVFTLNYDLCFEQIVGENKTIGLGFGSEDKVWHFSNFDSTEDISFFLYKLHGSIDWYIEEEKLKKSERPENNPELIFGIQNKMTSLDPYFFYSSNFRNTCLNEAKVIVIVGYSYADEYINFILTQALNEKPNLKLIDVSPDSDPSWISEELKINSSQIRSEKMGASDFFKSTLSKSYLEENFGKAEDSPF